MHKGISCSLEKAFLTPDTATLHKPAPKGHQVNPEAKTSPKSPHRVSLEAALTLSHPGAIFCPVQLPLGILAVPGQLRARSQ